ncbi:hypothetical protein Y032_0558g3412 [Ancylostoma ceylanicum]|uniref:Uncharacterized protein n=1 Tax=Ancylostoma ceylanicum TaxID=53326 RepID=A0A016WR24_9BILA|nr:hypothetical protein Y032_0558g3412 [Ancylostoma ceylanicum]
MPYTPLVSWLRSILGNESRCISPFLTWERHLTALPRIIWLPPFRGQIFPSPLVYSRLRPLPLQCGEDRLQSANNNDLTHHKSDCQFECFGTDRFLPVSTASPNPTPSGSSNCLYLRWNIRPTRTSSATSNL